MNYQLVASEASKASNVTILYGNRIRHIVRCDLMEELYTLIQYNPWPYVCLGTKPDLDTHKYLDAVDWLGLNLERTAGIQLYQDGVIRLNFKWECIPMDGKNKCMFDYDAKLKDTSKTELLYHTLLKLVN